MDAESRGVLYLYKFFGGEGIGLSTHVHILIIIKTAVSEITETVVFIRQSPVFGTLNVLK